MNFQLDDTIAALASAAGPAGRGIVRLSGPEAVSCVAKFFDADQPERWKAMQSAAVHRGTLRLPGLRSSLPVLVNVWPGTRSFTGQPIIEIHAPGSPPLLEAVLAEVFERGIRPAGPGEFTARAFFSGRLDLVQAEAVLGVIDAGDEQSLERALRQLAGGISGALARVRGDLMDLLADLEAGLDFVDEDISFISTDEVCRRIAVAEVALDELLTQCESRIQSAGRRRIVLAGLPNAGKSTLFNALLERNMALVSAAAGTTRDYLRGQANWSGLAVELVDTPGWEELPDGIMRQAYELGQDQWEQADLIVWCSACDFAASARRREAEIVESLNRKSRSNFLVRTKADLDEASQNDDVLAVSALTGHGLPELIAECARMLGSPQATSGEMIGTTAARCRESLVHGRESLSRGRQTAESGSGDELVALEIRETLEALGRVLGVIYTDDVLDRIFSRFCIGK